MYVFATSLIFVSPEHLSGFRIDQVLPSANRACDRLISLAFTFCRIVGDPTLHVQAGIGRKLTRPRFGGLAHALYCAGRVPGVPSRVPRALAAARAALVRSENLLGSQLGGVIEDGTDDRLSLPTIAPTRLSNPSQAGFLANVSRFGKSATYQGAMPLHQMAMAAREAAPLTSTLLWRASLTPTPNAPEPP